MICWRQAFLLGNTVRVQLTYTWLLWTVCTKFWRQTNYSYFDRGNWLWFSWWNRAVAIKSGEGRIWLHLQRFTGVLVHASIYGDNHKENYKHQELATAQLPWRKKSGSSYWANYLLAEVLTEVVGNPEWEVEERDDIYKLWPQDELHTGN